MRNFLAAFCDDHFVSVHLRTGPNHAALRNHALSTGSPVLSTILSAWVIAGN